MTDLSPRRRVALLVAVLVPLAIAAVSAVVVAATTGDPFAIVPVHWNLAGEVDGWAPAWTVPVTILVVGAVLATVFGLAASALWRDRAVVAPTPAPPLAIAPGERVVWVRHVVAPIGTLVLFGVLTLGAAAALVFAVGAGGPALAWFAVVPAILVLAGVTAMWARVRVDRAGLEVRCGIGLPVFRVPLADVDQAAVVAVVPFRDFGGWGWRGSPDGRFGVVLRTGEALEVRRGNGKRFVVTVDDAATAAALLNGLRSAPAAP